MIKSIKTFDLKEKRVLVRVDFNVPIENDKVVDDFRIRAALPTIQFCLNAGANVILMSHLGRPKGEIVPEMSLIPVGESLADLLEMPIKFSADCVSEDAHDVSLGLYSGEVHLLENLRFYVAEMQNDPDFSTKLAKHGQVYINDAFGTAHRSHASNVGVTRNFTHKGMGFLIEKELQYLSSAVKNPRRPLTVILGGAKIDTKLDLIHNFIGKADHILIGGGMAFTFLQAQGKDVGNSLVDPARLNTAKKVMARARGKSKLVFPKDIVCAESMKNRHSTGVYNAGKIPDKLMGLDIGPESINRFSQIIRESGTILWNGPMGVFEVNGFHKGTLAVAQDMAEVTGSGTTTIIGGGDSAAAVNKFGLMKKVTHVSTGGGASLELLSGNTLPAIYSLEI
ncbi:MAG: phosphoglycerate kinase [Candidatus Marinimicrobia bacterium]|nr:phosphoglycerate kinase [Candidatus Neomarinimicrobiota bacterium]MDP6611923.1 phosphoglycerate kinase [Candidatus Neomarinimicrobiota bacterium]